MRDRQRDEAISEAIDALEYVREHHVETARRLDEWRGKGYPTRSQMLSDIHSGRGGADPTGDRASTRSILDTFDIQRAKLDEDAERVFLAARRLKKLVQSVVCLANREKVEPECRLHALVPARREVFARELCEWCYRFEREWGVPPALSLVRFNAQGRRVSKQMIREHMPEVAWRDAEKSA